LGALVERLFNREPVPHQVGPAALNYDNRQEGVAVQAAFQGTRCGTHQELANDLQVYQLVPAPQDMGPRPTHVPRSLPADLAKNACNPVRVSGLVLPPRFPDGHNLSGVGNRHGRVTGYQ
jgi:hypothetical protein